MALKSELLLKNISINYMEKKINLLCLNILTKQVVGFLVTPNEISFKVK